MDLGGVVVKKAPAEYAWVVPGIWCYYKEPDYRCNPFHKSILVCIDSLPFMQEFRDGTSAWSVKVWSNEVAYKGSRVRSLDNKHECACYGLVQSNELA
jgi:hypothetical protein